VVDKHAALQTRLAVASQERAALAERRAALIVPPSAALASMRQLDKELAAARGALDVGFVVTVNQKRSLNIAVRKDTEPAVSASTDKALEIEANSEVELTIEDLASVLIRGGRREAQETARALEERWNREVLPHFAAAGVSGLASLDAKVVEAQELDSAIKTRDTEITSLGVQIAPLAASAESLQQALNRLENCRVALGGVAMESLSTDLDKLGADPVGGLRRLRERLSKEADSARRISSAAATAFTLAEERASSLGTLLAAGIAKRDLARISFPDGVDGALAAGRSRLASAAGEVQNAMAELTSLEKTMALQKARVEEAVSGARSRCEKAKLATDAAQATRDEARTAHAAQVGNLSALTKLRDAENLGAAETRLLEATARYEALPVPERPVTGDEVSSARSAQSGLALELDKVERDVHRSGQRVSATRFGLQVVHVEG
jgi:hypothetical protein